MVSLSGDITFHERGSIRDTLMDLAVSPQATEIEIDLQHVSCLDSSGLALLVDMYRHFNGRIRVVAIGDSQPDRLLKRANIMSFLNVRSVGSEHSSIQ